MRTDEQKKRQKETSRRWRERHPDESRLSKSVSRIERAFEDFDLENGFEIKWVN